MNILPLIYGGSNHHQPNEYPEWVVPVFFFGPLFLGIAYLIYNQLKLHTWTNGTFPQRLPMTKENLLEAHICLVAYFIQRDRRALREKMQFVHVHFNRHFPEEKYDFSSSLKSSYDYPITPVSVAQWMSKNNADHLVRKQLLIFLIQFSALDGLIINKEYVLLKQFAYTLGFSEALFQQLLEEHGPPPEEPVQHHNPNRLIALYSETLGIEPGATKMEIKQAYRALVKKHHPDKFQNAGDQIRQENQAHFIAIQEAYDYLYSH